MHGCLCKIKATNTPRPGGSGGAFPCRDRHRSSTNRAIGSFSTSSARARPVTIPIVQIGSTPALQTCGRRGPCPGSALQRNFRNGANSARHMQWSRIRVQRSDLSCMYSIGVPSPNLKSRARRTHRSVAETLRSGWWAGSAVMQSCRSIPRARSRAPCLFGRTRANSRDPVCMPTAYGKKEKEKDRMKKFQGDKYRRKIQQSNQDPVPKILRNFGRPDPVTGQLRADR